MEKAKLAEMVMQKMKAKQEEEEKRRPHFEVLRLQATFAKELHDETKAQVAMLEKQLAESKQTLTTLQDHINELDNTGKKSYPRIIIMPDFIASQHIKSEVKEFYRKSANSYLRNDIMRHKNHEEALQNEKDFYQVLEEVRELEEQVRNNREKDRNLVNEKRTQVLKQDLRLRSIIQQQKDIQATIEREQQENKDLLTEYQIKKLNLDNRKERLRQVQTSIEELKKLIEKQYNPISYRTHLKNVFDAQIKNEIMYNNLKNVTQKVTRLDNETKKFERNLEKSKSVVVLGRTADSPAAKRGVIQKRLQREKELRENMAETPVSQKLGMERGAEHKRSQSQRSMVTSQLALNLSSVGKSSGKRSIATTARTASYRHSVTRSLF